MEPLSCANCCHNPLRAGVVGLDYGFCTRHRVVLRMQTESTCGQLLRKDLLADSAKVFGASHAKAYPAARVVDLYEPRNAARSASLVGPPAEGPPGDEVVEETVAYASYERDSKIASLAALRRIGGIRGDVAMASLGRSYVQNCWQRHRRWTSGLHLLWWTLERLGRAPSEPQASDLRDVDGLPLPRAVSIAKWTTVALGVYLVSDIGAFASAAGDEVGRLAELADKALGAVEPGDGDGLARWLATAGKRYFSALPPERYFELSAALHKSKGRSSNRPHK